MLIRTQKERKHILHYTPAQEAALERKMEAKFRSQRETPNGRSFLWNTFRFRDKSDLENYRDNFDRINWGMRG
jgi:hypothetical protein